MEETSYDVKNTDICGLQNMKQELSNFRWLKYEEPELEELLSVTETWTEATQTHKKQHSIYRERGDKHTCKGTLQHVKLRREGEV